MNINYTSIFKLIASISFCAMLFSCSQTSEIPEHQIKAGVARVEGETLWPSLRNNIIRS